MPKYTIVGIIRPIFKPASYRDGRQCRSLKKRKDNRMVFFNWKEEYSVNIHEIDSQHQKLVGMLNDLYEALRKGEGFEALGNTLSELVHYTKIHFAAEERLMKTHGYSGYLSHRDKHEKMTKKVLEYARKYETGEIRSPIEISNFLKNWLKKHILQTDMDYSAFLNGKGVF